MSKWQQSRYIVGVSLNILKRLGFRLTNVTKFTKISSNFYRDKTSQPCRQSITLLTHCLIHFINFFLDELTYLFGMGAFRNHEVDVLAVNSANMPKKLLKLSYCFQLCTIFSYVPKMIRYEIKAETSSKCWIFFVKIFMLHSLSKSTLYWLQIAVQSTEWLRRHEM